jgi:outer membrane cobalamin receptor
MIYTENKKAVNFLGALVVMVTMFGCNIFSPTMSSYDSYAYSQTTSLKVDALNLMDSATSNYQSQVKSILTVNTSLQKLYSYVKNLPKNDITAKQWQILLDTNATATTGHLFGGFIVRWRNEKKLSRAFINGEKVLVGEAFDQIAELESKKIKSPTTTTK